MVSGLRETLAGKVLRGGGRGRWIENVREGYRRVGYEEEEEEEKGEGREGKGRKGIERGRN